MCLGVSCCRDVTKSTDVLCCDVGNTGNVVFTISTLGFLCVVIMESVISSVFCCDVHGKLLV